MRKLALALLFFTTPVSAFAQANEADVSCRAPVSLDDKACADMSSAAASDRQGTMEQRDDGYYVFVPRARD